MYYKNLNIQITDTIDVMLENPHAQIWEYMKCLEYFM